MSDDSNTIQQGATKLREALTQGRITLGRVQSAQEADIQVLRVREYWGDMNDEQQLITQGIKLRIAARSVVLSEQPTV